MPASVLPAGHEPFILPSRGLGAVPGNAAWQFMIARSGRSGRRAWCRMAASPAALAWVAVSEVTA